MADAFSTYTNELATADLNESQYRRALQQRLEILKRQREQSLLAGREGASSRGLLHSSIALKDIGDREMANNTEVAGTQQEFDNNISKVAWSRTNAANVYEAAKQEADRQKAADAASRNNDQIANGVVSGSFDPADPFNWKGIAAQANPDPLNWAAIAAEQQRNKGVATPAKVAGRTALPKPVPKVPTANRPLAPIRGAQSGW